MSSGDLTVITIDLLGDEPDVLERIALVNGALLRVLGGGSRLIRVQTADYQRGHMEVLVESPRSRPRVSGRVAVHYQPVSSG